MIWKGEEGFAYLRYLRYGTLCKPILVSAHQLQLEILRGQIMGI